MFSILQIVYNCSLSLLFDVDIVPPFHFPSPRGSRTSLYFAIFSLNSWFFCTWRHYLRRLLFLFSAFLCISLPNSYLISRSHSPKSFFHLNYVPPKSTPFQVDSSSRIQLLEFTFAKSLYILLQFTLIEFEMSVSAYVERRYKTHSFSNHPSKFSLASKTSVSRWHVYFSLLARRWHKTSFDL